MKTTEKLSRPTKAVRKTAMDAYSALEAVLNEIDSESPEITITETQEKIEIPMGVLKMLAQILKVTSEGKPVSIVPIETEMTTQAAAELLGCSRPHLVKLLENGEINFTKVGKHRRVMFDDIIKYKKQAKLKQRELIRAMMKSDEDLGLYDS